MTEPVRGKFVGSVGGVEEKSVWQQGVVWITIMCELNYSEDVGCPLHVRAGAAGRGAERADDRGVAHGGASSSPDAPESWLKPEPEPVPE